MNIPELTIGQTAALPNLSVPTLYDGEVFFPLTIERTADTAYTLTASIGLSASGMTDDLAAFEIDKTVEQAIATLKERVTARGMTFTPTPEDIGGYDWVITIPLVVGAELVTQPVNDEGDNVLLDEFREKSGVEMIVSSFEDLIV